MLRRNRFGVIKSFTFLWRYSYGETSQFHFLNFLCILFDILFYTLSIYLSIYQKKKNHKFELHIIDPLGSKYSFHLIARFNWTNIYALLYSFDSRYYDWLTLSQIAKLIFTFMAAFRYQLRPFLSLIIQIQKTYILFLFSAQFTIFPVLITSVRSF